MMHAAPRQVEGLENRFHGIEKNLGRKIHHRQKFFVKRPMLGCGSAVAVDQVIEIDELRIDVAFQIFEQEPRQRWKTRAHRTPGAGMRPWHVRDRCLFEPRTVLAGGHLIGGAGIAAASIGPPINTMDAGWLGLSLVASRDTAAKTGTLDWLTANRWVSGPMTCRARITVSINSSRPNGPTNAGTMRASRQSVT